MYSMVQFTARNLLLQCQQSTQTKLLQLTRCLRKTFCSEMILMLKLKEFKKETNNLAHAHAWNWRESASTTLSYKVNSDNVSKFAPCQPVSKFHTLQRPQWQQRAWGTGLGWEGFTIKGALLLLFCCLLLCFFWIAGAVGPGSIKEERQRGLTVRCSCKSKLNYPLILNTQ